MKAPPEQPEQSAADLTRCGMPWVDKNGIAHVCAKEMEHKLFHRCHCGETQKKEQT